LEVEALVDMETKQVVAVVDKSCTHKTKYASLVDTCTQLLSVQEALQLQLKILQEMMAHRVASTALPLKVVVAVVVAVLLAGQSTLVELVDLRVAVIDLVLPTLNQRSQLLVVG
jgi:hypothetical protein